MWYCLQRWQIYNYGHVCKTFVYYENTVSCKTWTISTCRSVNLIHLISQLQQNLIYGIYKIFVINLETNSWWSPRAIRSFAWNITKIIMFNAAWWNQFFQTQKRSVHCALRPLERITRLLKITQIYCKYPPPDYSTNQCSNSMYYFFFFFISQ